GARGDCRKEQESDQRQEALHEGSVRVGLNYSRGRLLPERGWRKGEMHRSLDQRRHGVWRRKSQAQTATKMAGSQIQRNSLCKTATPRAVKNGVMPIGETRIGVHGKK